MRAEKLNLSGGDLQNMLQNQQQSLQVISERVVGIHLTEQSRSAESDPKARYELLRPSLLALSGVLRQNLTEQETLSNEIQKWQEKLDTIANDAQLANVDLQNMLQKQQQTLQQISNITKTIYDTCMSVIRKIGG